MKLVYPVVLYPSGVPGGYTVLCPDMPGLVTEVKPDEPDGIVTLISLDMDSYAEKYGRKSVRKNVTIPAWLDTFGEQAGINYSQVLREGLERRYNDLQNA